MYCVWQVVKAPTIILNNPIYIYIYIYTYLTGSLYRIFITPVLYVQSKSWNAHITVCFPDVRKRNGSLEKIIQRLTSQILAGKENGRARHAVCARKLIIQIIFWLKYRRRLLYIGIITLVIKYQNKQPRNEGRPSFPFHTSFPTTLMFIGPCIIVIVEE